MIISIKKVDPRSISSINPSLKRWSNGNHAPMKIHFLKSSKNILRGELGHHFTSGTARSNLTSLRRLSSPIRKNIGWVTT